MKKTYDIAPHGKATIERLDNGFWKVNVLGMDYVFFTEREALREVISFIEIDNDDED